MTKQNIEKLFELIDEIVRGNETWKWKRDFVRAHASEDDKMNLIEFSAWFAEEENA